jgi:hypothetical protein
MNALALLDETPLADGDTDDFPVVWRQDAEGLRAEIRQEQDGCEFANPRDMDQLGTMVCWHPDYVLGDEQITNGDGGRGAVTNAHAHAGRFRSIGMLARWAQIAEQAPVVIPLYLYDHSGISMTAGHNAVGMGDTASGGTDEFGQARGWDTTCVGIIYTTPARILELCGGPRPEQIERGERFYCPDDWTGTPESWLEEQLENEVKSYDAYLRGDVFYWCVEDIETEDIIESCAGYLPDVSADYSHQLDYVKEEARGSLAYAIETKREAAAKYAETARCWHADCREGHPLSDRNVTEVSCRSCREWLGLTELEETGQ